CATIAVSGHLRSAATARANKALVSMRPIENVFICWFLCPSILDSVQLRQSEEGDRPEPCPKRYRDQCRNNHESVDDAWQSRPSRESLSAWLGNRGTLGWPLLQQFQCTSRSRESACDFYPTKIGFDRGQIQWRLERHRACVAI